MPRILACKAFAKKDMPQMSTTSGTDNLRAHAVCVFQTTHRTGYLVVEARPSAMGFKLIFRLIKRCPTAFADVCTGFVEVVVFSGKRPLCVFMHDNGLFFGCQLMIFHCVRFLFICFLFALRAT